MKRILTILAATAISAAPAAMADDDGPVVIEISAGSTTSDAEPARLTVYPASRPADSGGKMVMMCPGGGYAMLATGHEGHDMAPWFNERGITYAVLEYRLPGGDRRLPISDAEEAMRVLRQRAEQWGADPHKAGVAGASAGGHLAASLSTLYTDSLSRPDFTILFYPVVSMTDSLTHRGSRDNLLGCDATADDERQWSAELHVDGSTPPAFVMLSADDDVVDPRNSLRYIEALTAAGVGSSLHIYPTGGHGWGFSDTFRYKPDWTAALDTWLNQLIINQQSMAVK